MKLFDIIHYLNYGTDLVIATTDNKIIFNGNVTELILNATKYEELLDMKIGLMTLATDKYRDQFWLKIETEKECKNGIRTI